MVEGEVKALVPESVLKKQLRSEEWALAKKNAVIETRKKNLINRKVIFNKAKKYANEYAAHVRIKDLRSNI